MHENELVGAAILGYCMTHAGVSASQADDAISGCDPQELHALAALAGYTNGSYVATPFMREQVERALVPPPPVAEPTHALPGPPDLTDGPLDQSDEIRARRLASLFTGEHQVPRCHVCRHDLLKDETGWTCINPLCPEKDMPQ